MHILPAIDELAEFFALKFPKDIMAFRPSEKVSSRIESLVNKEKNGQITSIEQSELDKYMLLEHLMRVAKAKV